MDAESVLKRLVRIARETLCISENMNALGLADSPYFSIHGDAADAIYYFLGEDTKSFEESVTYKVLHETVFSDDDCVRLFMKEYRKNKQNAERIQPVQPLKNKISARPKRFPETRYSKELLGCAICGHQIPFGDNDTCPTCGSGIILQ